MRSKYKISKKLQITDDKSKLKVSTKYGYGTGQIMNDMCTSMWLAYALIYYMNVVKIDPMDAGIIVSAGTFVEGIALVVVGILIDIDNPFRLCIIYGRKKVDDV